MEPAIDATEITPEARHFPEPFASQLGPYEGRRLADHFGLTQFGANLDSLPPQSQSALRHWHSMSDEFVYVIEGELTLVTEDGESNLTAGMCVGFKAGDDNAHHLINRSSKVARFLVIGTRVDEDKVHYPNDDLKWLRQKDGTWYPTRKDGARY